MDELQRELFHARRRELFAGIQLPAKAIAALNALCAEYDYEIALETLEDYRTAVPYRGFFVDKFDARYRDAWRRRTAIAPERARAAYGTPVKVQESEQQLRERFEALPEDHRENCQRVYAEWGIRVGTVQWWILCIDAADGVDVSVYRIQPMIGSKGYDLVESIRKQAAWRAERGYLDLVAALRAEVKRCNGNIDIVA